MISGFGKADPAEAPVRRLVAVIATEEQGQLLHVRRLHSR